MSGATPLGSLVLLNPEGPIGHEDEWRLGLFRTAGHYLGLFRIGAHDKALTVGRYIKRVFERIDGGGKEASTS